MDAARQCQVQEGYQLIRLGLSGKAQDPGAIIHILITQNKNGKPQISWEENTSDQDTYSPQQVLR